MTRWVKTREASLDCLQRRGLMVSFGNASGAVTGVNLGILNQKGSLYVTRPSLQGYITNREELEEASNELFSLIASGVIKVDVADAQKYPLTDAQRAHEVLESRATQGSSLLIPDPQKKLGFPWEALSLVRLYVGYSSMNSIAAAIVTDSISKSYSVLSHAAGKVTSM